MLRSRPAAGDDDPAEASAAAATQRLGFRSFEAADTAAMESVLCDPRVMRFSDDGVLSREAVAAWIAKTAQTMAVAPGFGLWAVVERATGTVIGYAGLGQTPGRCAEGEAELGYRLAHRFWGRGFGSEAAGAMVAHGLRTLGLPRLIALVDPGNTASIRTLEKIGMAYERDVIFPGYSHPDRLYAIDATARR